MPDIMLMAEEPPVVYLDKESTQKVFDWMTFSVTIDQMKSSAPSIYERLRYDGKLIAKVLVIHGMESGNFSVFGRLALQEHQPDVVICCHPSDVRHLNTDLPIWGWSNKAVYINIEPDSRIVRVFTSD